MLLLPLVISRAARRTRISDMPRSAGRGIGDCSPSVLVAITLVLSLYRLRCSVSIALDFLTTATADRPHLIVVPCPLGEIAVVAAHCLADQRRDACAAVVVFNVEQGLLRCRELDGNP